MFCKTLNIWFKTITSAANFAKADNWTMSRKMDVLGSFIDANGNEYIREKPMRTKNNYTEHFNTMVAKRTIVRRKKQTVKSMEYMLVKQPAFADYPKPIQNLIKEKLTDMITNNKPWAEIKQFMKDTGCKELTIRADNE